MIFKLKTTTINVVFEKLVSNLRRHLQILIHKAIDTTTMKTPGGNLGLQPQWKQRTVTDNAWLKPLTDEVAINFDGLCKKEMGVKA